MKSYLTSLRQRCSKPRRLDRGGTVRVPESAMVDRYSTHRASNEQIDPISILAHLY